MWKFLGVAKARVFRCKSKACEESQTMASKSTFKAFVPKRKIKSLNNAQAPFSSSSSTNFHETHIMNKFFFLYSSKKNKIKASTSSANFIYSFIIEFDHIFSSWTSSSTTKIEALSPLHILSSSTSALIYFSLFLSLL